MSWLITGASGQLGIAVSQELGRRGILFHAWSSQDLDITKGPIVRDVISKLSPKTIINCAAWTDVDGAEVNELQAARVNIDGALNIALAAKECGAKLIQISTDYVFSGESQIPWQVADEINPKSAYGRTKVGGESRVLETYPENSFIVRTAWLYSPWGKNFSKTITKLALNGQTEVPVVIDQIGQPTSALDLASQLVDLGLSNSHAGIYHGTNSGQATWFDFAVEIFRLAGEDSSRVVPISTADLPRPAKRPAFSVLGHEAWAKTTIPVMRDWRIALTDAMPAIISAVKTEG
jgi:dTDP-4-dehydrorhamnose reductase